MPTFAELKRNLKKDFSTLRPTSVAVLADSATQQLVQALRGAGYEQGLDLVILETDYGQGERQIMDASSELYRFEPQFVLLYFSVETLHAGFLETPVEERDRFAAARLESLRGLIGMLRRGSQARIICMNFPELDDGVFGGFANKVPSSWLSQLRRINVGLMDLAAAEPALFVCDLAALVAEHGRDWLTSRRIALGTQLLISVEALPAVAQRSVDIIAAASGRFKKCLVLDLDNTLWGGVIGDDGLENIEVGELGVGAAHTQLQAWALELKRRGVILAVCSKNDPAVAAQPFDAHPDMTLRMADFALFVASWDNKVDGLRHIQSVLEIGFDSMVFLDDNPAEREIVRRNLPAVCVPELPEDPVDWLPFLVRANLFETVAITAEDANRTRRYQAEGRRRALQTSFATEEEFLRSLEMRAQVQGFTAFNTPRVAQLTQRSNQFNLRTVRYSEDDIRRLASSPHHVALAFTLADELGDHGLIAVAILADAGRDLFIDTWLMSCRVLRRGMEAFVLNTLVRCARERGREALVGEYLPTAKNALVRDHYAALGFSEADGRWRLEVAAFTPRTTFITEKVSSHAS